MIGENGPVREVSVFLPLLTLAAHATTLDELLARGPVSVVQTAADGHLEQITVYGRVDAPVEVVWEKLVAFDAYESWMPQVDAADVTRATGDTVEVSWSIRVPGPNFKFTAAYTLDASARTIVATGTAGGLSGGKWQWRLTPHGDGTLVERTTYASAVIDNWLVRQFDDAQHSLEIGLNAASPLLEVRGLQDSFSRPAR